ncbi:adenosine/AMP deaminase domain protein [Bacteriovorax sp. BSW11_IV]|uniref:adenosine/AMP deaminase n=1 Tax=Bacteriovorax sp. BSW11_IV TaxID=1353529 RepID=UPI00038A080A|nr:adenosine/AMP deaminase [Bacteriovorax sp. BSW11_IV]EQC49218.1 adenosine/AMP deaminase domain protein [Bacteriovorax sp. BSW11_IV]
MPKRDQIVEQLYEELVKVISETNGISLWDTLELLQHAPSIMNNPAMAKPISEFHRLLVGFHSDEVEMDTLLGHPLSQSLFSFFKAFPLPYHEEHIHLTGSLSAEFIYPRLKVLLEGKNKAIYEKKIKEVYGEDSIPINSVEDVDNLIRLKEGEQFKQYLKILYLPKLILNSKEAHYEAAYHMARDLYEKYNVGRIRLKFTLSRSTGIESEQIPGLDEITEQDVVYGLYDGFMAFKKENPFFDFILSPSFRKELDFYDKENFKSKKEHFIAQVDSILDIIANRPELKKYLCEVDTVGDEKELYRKVHFDELRSGLRKLQYNGFSIRSHHGETWKTLRKGVQSVDNSMNIWHIDTLEHGLSLGINPNFYFHRLFQRVMDNNKNSKPITPGSSEESEILDMEWYDQSVKEKLLKGIPINAEEEIQFIKTKFHAAREIEHYQHDVLNRMIHKQVSLVALPTSNLKLTGSFPDYKDHPFSWWEKKGVHLGVGTDNYITLSTNYIQELLILLFSDPYNLKITKLLMVSTKESRRPYISHLLWEMRKKLNS